MGFRLGIDGGGTKTECVLADETGTILARATAGPSNLLCISEEAVRTAFSDAIDSTFAAAGVKPAPVEAVCAGLAGAGRAEVRERATRLLARLVRAGEIFVTSDVEVALEAAVGPGAGVIVIAGTGSMAFGRTETGQQARAGGWGPAVSDEGSATDMGRGAVRAVLAARDGRGPATVLSAHVLEVLGVSAVDDLPLALDAKPFERFAALFPVVLEAARARDAVALGILESAARDLAELAGTVIRVLSFGERQFVLAYSGGVFKRFSMFDELVERRLRALSEKALVRWPDVSPGVGAIRLAERLLLERSGKIKR